MIYEDAYGCKEEGILEIENEWVWSVGVDVLRDGIVLDHYEGLRSDIRLCAEVDGNIYYSQYGQDRNVNKKAISYPTLPSNSIVNIWLESTNGSESEKEQYTVKDCEMDSESISGRAYPRMLIGSYKQGEYSYEIKLVSAQVKIDGKEYIGKVDKEGNFSVSYPFQNNGKKVTLVLKDEHGCQYEYISEVYNDMRYYELRNYKVYMNKVCLDYVPKGCKLYVKIENKIYSSNKTATQSEKALFVTYPQQKLGTPIQIWVEKENGCISKKIKTTISSGSFYFEKKVVTTTYISARISEEEVKLKQCYAIIDGKKYKGKNGNYNFKITYPVKAVGKKVKVVLVDTDGFTYHLTYEIKNVRPRITLYQVDSGSDKVSGNTSPKAQVTVTVGNRKYKTKANSKGRFSVKIKQVKTGTLIVVKVKTTKGYTGTEKGRVKTAEGDIEIPHYVYFNSKKITCKVYNGKKGDTIKVSIGKKTYKKKLKSNNKHQNIKLTIKQVSAGTKIKVMLYDKFGKRKSFYNSKVYYGNSISIGMSEKNAVLTTWGVPDYKNNWGLGSEQWVYSNGRTRLYVYVRNGKVVDIQKIHF